MIEQVINLLVLVLMFCIAAYGLFWVCDRAKLPEPAYWICGVVLLIVILLFLSGQITGPTLFHQKH